MTSIQKNAHSHNSYSCFSSHKSDICFIFLNLWSITYKIFGIASSFLKYAFLERTSYSPGQLRHPGRKPLVVNGVVVGLFEEEKEGISIASDVAKVMGEGLVAPRLSDMHIYIYTLEVRNVV